MPLPAPAAREVLEEVDDALDQNLSPMMREGPEEALTLTENAQPAIMANSIATLRVLEREFGVPVAKARCVAGHSLGEYSALAAIDAFTLADTARLLKLRGRAMQEAVPVGEGAMAALLGADLDTATRLATAVAQDEVCEVANDNDPTQVVVSGHRRAVERAVAQAKDHGIKRGLLLPVSAPFHCSLMQPAADRMAEALTQTPPQALALPLYANVTAEEVTDAAAETRHLVEQVTGRVRWRESVLAMGANGIAQFVEIGGKVLSPMVARTLKDAETVSLVAMSDLESYARTI